MMGTQSVRLALLSGVFFVSLCCRASAADDTDSISEEKPLWELGFGAGGLILPDYPASSSTHTRGLVLPYTIYRGEVLRIGDGQSARAVAAESNLFELSMSFDAAFDARSDGNATRLGMPDLDFMFEAGPQLIFNLDRSDREHGYSELQFALQARGVFSTDFGRIDHRGYVFEPMLRYRHFGLFTPRFDGSISVRPVWASRSLHGYFYDVPEQFVTDARPAYSAADGYFGTGINFYGTWHLTEKIRLFFGIETTSHHGARNRDSPLFEKDFTAGFGAGVIMSVFESRRRVQVP